LAAQVVGERIAAAGPAERGLQGLQAFVRGQVEADGGFAILCQGIPERSRKGVDQAAFDPLAADDEFSPARGKARGAGADVFHRRAGKTLPEMFAQGTMKPQLAGRKGARAMPRSASRAPSGRRSPGAASWRRPGRAGWRQG